MSLRPTQNSIFQRIQGSLLADLARLARAQEQVSSGKRILRASDDPIGASRALAYEREIAASERYSTALQGARTMLDTAASALQDAGGLVAEARALVLQAMNGTQSPADRRTLGQGVALIREQLLDLANSRTGNRYLFAGTSTGSKPFVPSAGGGIAYAGNDETQRVLVGLDSQLATTLPGDEVFALEQRSGTRFDGRTGIASGTSADQGTGYLNLQVRHDATAASGLGGGLALASGGALDTILGAHTLVVDAVAGTVRLDNGPLERIPATGAGNAADFVVTNEHGAEVHLDFSAFAPASFTASLTGSGSISLDGGAWTAMTLAETDLELRDPASGTVLHLDTRGLHRAGAELVTFGGAVNLFDVLQGIAEDLAGAATTGSEDLVRRLDLWLGELDRNHENVQVATGELGSLSQRASGLEESLGESSDQVRGLLSAVEDADYSQVVLEMTRAEHTLQLTQASSVRILQNSLLNFLR